MFHFNLKSFAYAIVNHFGFRRAIRLNRPIYNRGSRKFLRQSALLFACFSIPTAASAANVIVDSRNNKVGIAVASNTALFQSGSFRAQLRFQSPGFDPIYDDLQSVTFYYKSSDCSGEPFYSDQADGKWKPNNTPSIYDVPPRGILIGTIPSKIDQNFFSQVEIYIPIPPFRTITFESIRRVGVSRTVSDCEKVSGSGDFVALKKLRTEEFFPPFRMIEK